MGVVLLITDNCPLPGGKMLPIYGTAPHEFSIIHMVEHGRVDLAVSQHVDVVLPSTCSGRQHCENEKNENEIEILPKHPKHPSLSHKLECVYIYV